MSPPGNWVESESLYIWLISDRDLKTASKSCDEAAE
uniref:Uncharacterized protein n=1 Tax=Brassica oleracea TaxID=3712 RepID=A0A3P6GZZ0_BRAOL|nr:unnamed protein product [Brassica oleracea]